jgi:hypothetical protein
LEKYGYLKFISNMKIKRGKRGGLMGGNIIYTNLNTTGVVNICIEALRLWGHSPQYIYPGLDTLGPKNYDKGTLINWKNGSHLIEVGVPGDIPAEFRKASMPAGARALVVLPGCGEHADKITQDLHKALRAKGAYVDSQDVVPESVLDPGRIAGIS